MPRRAEQVLQQVVLSTEDLRACLRVHAYICMNLCRYEAFCTCVLVHTFVCMPLHMFVRLHILKSQFCDT
jgi:hypothetical protein